MRYCVIDKEEKTVKTIGCNRWPVWTPYDKVTKERVKFYTEPPTHAKHYKTVLTEDELDMLLIEEKLKR
jgi:hypothetical protein